MVGTPLRYHRVRVLAVQERDVAFADESHVHRWPRQNGELTRARHWTSRGRFEYCGVPSPRAGRRPSRPSAGVPDR